MGLFLQEYIKYNKSFPDLRWSPDGCDAGASRMARDVMMAARSTPNLVPAGRAGPGHDAKSAAAVASGGGAVGQQHSHHHASIYSYLHTQSGLNFAPVVPHRQGDGGSGGGEGGGGSSAGTASPPPAPPVRDSSSLKGVKYGPGHEKFPSWPVSAAADTPVAARPAPGGGSHRSKSWTDHTNYPKEKGITYTRPYMKRPNPAFTQQLKTVMERCEKIPPEAFESRDGLVDDGPQRLFLPRVDREGKELGDLDYLVPSPPERDVEEFKAASGGGGGGAGSGGTLTQADLEEYARAYHPPQPPSSYAQSEGYHSYVSSSDSTTTTPFLDRLRRDSEMASEGRPVPGPQAPSSLSSPPSSWDEASSTTGDRAGRDSVVTTSSGSASSSETLKWHGSLSDVSVASSSCTQPASSSSSSSARQLIAHSARVQTPQRHHSESVLYLGGGGGGAGQSARVQRNNQHNNKLRLFPVHTYTVQPQQVLAQQPQQGHRNMPVSSPTQPTLSVAERISELERQQRQQQHQQQQQQQQSVEQQQQQQQTRYTYYDPDKRHRVSDPTLKAIQKKALLSFYERHHQVPVMQATIPGRGHQTTWRSEPHLAQPTIQVPCPPQSPPPPQPPPRPRNGTHSSRRASSASDYAGGNWRETAASREPVASESNNNIRDSTKHQHSSSCGTLSSDLLGPVIMGPPISVDDWVPERPPKKPHLRTAFPPPVPDRMVSPDLPPPSPPPIMEDEVFATDEPLPPPPPELHPTDWTRGSDHNLDKSQKSSESSNDVPRYPEKENSASLKQPEYTNLPPRLSDQQKHHNENNSQRMDCHSSQDGYNSRHRQENPPSPQRSHAPSSSFQRYGDGAPVPQTHSEISCHRQHECDISNNSSLHRQQDSISQKHSDLSPTEQKHADMCSMLAKHGDNRSSEMTHFVQKYSQNAMRYSENSNHVQKHPDTEFSNHRYLENGSTAHPRILETGHAVHRHLETGAAIQRHNEAMQRQVENNHNNLRHSEVNHRHMESSFSLPRSAPQRLAENENVPSRPSESYQHGNSSLGQRHMDNSMSQKFSESFSSMRSFQHESMSKPYKHDECSNHQYSHNSNHRGDARQFENCSHPHKHQENDIFAYRNQHNNSSMQKSFENGMNSHSNHGPPSPKKENISSQKCVENGAMNQGHVDNRYFENGGSQSNHRYPEGAPVNRRYLESNRSLDGSSAMCRYHDCNMISQKNSNMYNRPSGMRSTENLHQKCLEPPSSKTLENWANQKYSTQKLVVNGKLAVPLPERPMQNGGFTESLRMSDLERTNRRNGNNFSSMPARARLQRLPLAVPNGDLPPKSQSSLSPNSCSPTHSLSPTGPRSPPRSQAPSPRSPGHGHSPTEHQQFTIAKSPPREKVPSPPHLMMTHANSNQNFSDHAAHNEQSSSKASYIAYRRERDRDRGLPNFEGSYKRTMSPSERPEVIADTPGSSPVPECDRLSIPESSSTASTDDKRVSRAASQRSLETASCCSDKCSPSLEGPRLRGGAGGDSGSVGGSSVGSCSVGGGSSSCSAASSSSSGGASSGGGSSSSGIVVELLEQRASPASDKRRLPTPETTPPPTPRGVETETQTCDLRGNDAPVRDAMPASPQRRTPPSSPKRSPPPSPVTKTTASTPASTPSPRPGSPKVTSAPKVTESLQLVQRSEVVLRVNAATSDAASQTEAEREATPPPTTTATTATPATPPPEPSDAPVAAAAAPAAMLVRPKTQEEIECERLSLDLASQLPPTDKLQTLLVPDPDHKKPTDYVSGLFKLDVALRPRAALAPSLRNNQEKANSEQNGTDQNSSEDSKKEDTTASSAVSPLPANSKYFTISESKAKFLNRYVRDIGQLNGVHDKDLHRKKEELVSRLDRKLEVLRGERLLVNEESRVNEELGASVAAQVSRLAQPHEAAKYRLHVEEVGKITSLLLALSGRLARAENALMGLPSNHPERKILESKRDKLKEQLEEAKMLKENIDRRSISVSNILYKYFNSEEYTDYDHFINMKAKLIMDSREIADKIKLGEEQLAALRETLHTPSD